MKEQKVTDFSLHHAIYPARSGDGPHPGLLLLHGRGTDEQDLLSLAAQLDPRLFAVSARGPRLFPYGGFAWYELDPTGVGYPEPASLNQSLELLRKFVREIVDAYPIDPNRLFVGGFSMGSAMSAALALTDPEHVAGAAILSGYLPLAAKLPFKLENAAGHPIFQAHGVLDQVIPVRWGRETRDYLESTPVALTYREYPVGHEISAPELRDLAGWLTAAIDGSASPGNGS